MEYILHGLYGHPVQNNVEEGERDVPEPAPIRSQCTQESNVKDLLFTYLQDVTMPFAEVRT